MIRVGIVGIGFMGMIHYLAYQRVRGIKTAAIVSRDEKKRLGDWRGIQGNFGPPGQKMDLRGVRAYSTLDALLDDPQIDLVDICLPPSQHAAATIAALKAGKHVFCEKPMALSDDDCRRMVQAAKKSGRQLFVGHVLPWFPEFDFARRAVASGKYGRPLGGYFKRVISDPLWLKDFYNPTIVGGPLIDLHVHDAHFIRLLFGLPHAVTSQGRMRGEVVAYCHTLFHFARGLLAVAASSGVIDQQGRSFTHGFELHLEEATLQYEMAVLGGKPHVLLPLTVLDKKGRAQQPSLKGDDPIDAFAGEIREIQRSLQEGKPSPILGADLARDAIRLCHAQTESVRQMKTVEL